MVPELLSPSEITGVRDDFYKIETSHDAPRKTRLSVAPALAAWLALRAELRARDRPKPARLRTPKTKVPLRGTGSSPKNSNPIRRPQQSLGSKTKTPCDRVCALRLFLSVYGSIPGERALGE